MCASETQPSAEYVAVKVWADRMMGHLDIDRIAAWDPEVAKYIVWLERKLAEARGEHSDGSVAESPHTTPAHNADV